MNMKTVASGICTCLSTIGLWYSAYVFLMIIPKFEIIFKDLGIRLPESTSLFIALSHCSFGYVLVLAGILMIAKELIMSEKTRLVLSLVGILFTLLLVVLIQSAMLQPLVEIVRQLDTKNAT